MPVCKPRLTRRDRARYLAVARELSATGYITDIPYELRDEVPAQRLTIARSPESLIYQLSPSQVL